MGGDDDEDSVEGRLSGLSIVGGLDGAMKSDWGWALVLLSGASGSGTAGVLGG